jgi:hypothetical protein
VAGAVGLDGVFVAGDFEAFFAFFEAHHGDVCEFYLVGGLVYGHFGGWMGGDVLVGGINSRSEV